MEIKLPKPLLDGDKSLEECIYERESIRKYQDKVIEIEKISQILWSAQGAKGQKRTVPSAGATYPLEIYVTLKDKGYFHYIFENHSLKLINEENISKKLAEESWNQKFIEQAYLNILICADYSRTTQRYGERGINWCFPR
jgi:SagB-type dehydrogenase family enzyme